MQCPWPFTKHGWTPLRGVIGIVDFLLFLAILFGLLNDWSITFTAFSLIAQTLIFYWIEDRGGRDLELLMGRLRGYSCLSFGNEKCDPCGNEKCDHRILLGTLKKVEGKATSLAAILVFIAIALVTVGGSDLMGFPDAKIKWISAILLTLLPSFLALTFAFRQLDNLHFDAEAKSEGLSAALKNDLLQKEHCFRFAWCVAVFYTVLGFLVLFYSLFWPE